MGMGEKLEEWEYSDHVAKDTVVTACETILGILKNDTAGMLNVVQDTRPSHKEMFKHVVPGGRDYLAGNYRGAPYPQLVDRPVFIGVFSCGHFSQVEMLMQDFHEKLYAGLQRISDFFKASSFNSEQKIIAFSKFVSTFFVRFLTIHPYANGNGHISRLLVWCIFNYKSVKCAFWSVPDRNLSPPDRYIGYFREGKTEPLIQSFAELIERENSGKDLH